MEAGRPDTVENVPQGRSLVAGLHAAIRDRLGRRSAPAGDPPRSSPVGRRLALAVALLIAAGPLATLVGAELLARQARSATAALDARLAPRMAAERDAEQARAAMRAMVAQPTLGATLDAVARALPADAAVVRAERGPDGALELEVSALDPDQLRPALRVLPGIGTFRNVGQRQNGAAMIVSFRSEGR
jgi:hypothetical protein